MMNIESLLEFIKEADKLKKVERQALIHSGGRRENTAEHSWHLALAALVFEKFAPKDMDMSKALKMALLHDIVEIDAGDTFVYADLSNKAASEAQAIDRLTSLLPGEVGEDLKAIWQEFEAGDCAEAEYISAIDRFLPIYSNYLNEGYSWKKHNISSARIAAKCEAPIVKGIPALWDVTKRMMEESISKGHLTR